MVLCRHNSYNPFGKSIMEKAQQYFTFEEAAEYLRVSKATMYRWTHNYNLHYIKVGRVSRISKKDIDDFMQSPEFRM